jgi:hypothetical protein
MGQDAAPTELVSREQARRAASELKGMQRALRAWLRYRRINDAVAAGREHAVRTPLLKLPGAHPPAAAAMRRVLSRQRREDEQELALQLHTLLSEAIDPAQLPRPDVSRDPDAAAKLAEIAIGGKLPGEAVAPAEVGFWWMWPFAIAVGALAFIVTSAIRNKAEMVKERERYECIKAGKCTDYGFWLKVGGIAAVVWVAWDKFGLGARVRGLLGKGGGASR